MQARSVIAATVVVTVLTGGCASVAPDATGGSRPPAEPPTRVPPSPEDGVERKSPRSAPDAAPNFTLTDFEGARFELYDHLGKPVVVNFWDSW